MFSDPCLTYLLNGSKTIESRLSKNKILPFLNISKDDVVFVKKSSGKVMAYFTINEVIFLEIEKFSLQKIREKYGEALCVDEEFWRKKAQARYATLISVNKVVRLDAFAIQKSGMQTWLKLN